MSYYATIKATDIADGHGVRVAVFLSGCPHHCPGCFNSEAWDYTYGQPFTEKTMNEIKSMLDKPYIQGVTLLGGEPLDPKNIETSAQIAAMAKSLDKDVWVYTGYSFETIRECALYRNAFDDFCIGCTEILLNCDVMVDGRFEQDLADKRLVFRGSSNQRIIDVQATLATSGGEPVLMSF